MLVKRGDIHMIKKFFIFFIMILLIIGLSGKVLAKDKYTATSNINGVTVNWEYELNDSNQIENLRCTNVSELTGNITIPNTLDGKTVISIGSEAFKSATNITGVTVSDSIKTIGYSAFKNCTNLIEIVIPQGVKTIEIDAFRYCTNLRRLQFPSSLIKIGSYAFSECEKITSISISSRKIKIDDVAFRNCTSLNTIHFDTIFPNISFCAFNGCTSLSSIIVPKTDWFLVGVYRRQLNRWKKIIREKLN